MEKTNIGKNIYEMRVFRNIEKKSLAKNCGVDIETVSKWESGDVIPNAEELFVIAKALKTTADYFSVDLDQERDYGFINSYSDTLLTAALATLSAVKRSNPLHKITTKRNAIAELINLKLLTLDAPQYSLTRTTEKQRKDAISCFEDLINEECEDILKGYVAGEIEISDLDKKFFERAKMQRDKDKEEKDRKKVNPTWKIYISVIERLENALNNEFIDLRYANKAIEELGAYLENKTDSINDVVLENIYKNMKTAYAEQNEDELRSILSLLQIYGDVLWSQLN